jgi:hypothetical protein
MNYRSNRHIRVVELAEVLDMRATRRRSREKDFVQRHLEWCSACRRQVERAEARLESSESTNPE